MKALTGILPLTRGSIEVFGKIITSNNHLGPRILRELGIAHVPEDRQRMGLITEFSASETALLGYHNDEHLNQGLWLKKALVR